MQENEEIKKCPFCGSDADFEYDDFNPETGEGDDGIGWIKCKNAKCGIGIHDDRDSAIEKWNNRRNEINKVIMIPADTRYFTGNQKGQQMYGRPAITNNMKAECVGEFTWEEQADYYDENGNVVEHTATRTVPRDLCKEIYRRMAQEAAKEAL